VSREPYHPERQRGISRLTPASDTTIGRTQDSTQDSSLRSE